MIYKYLLNVLVFCVIAASHPRPSPAPETFELSNIAASFRSKSFPLYLFADPHPLTPVASIFNKNRGTPTILQPNNTLWLTKSFRMLNSEKSGGGGGKLLTGNPKKDFYPEGNRKEGPFLNPITVAVLSNRRKAKDLAAPR